MASLVNKLLKSPTLSSWVFLASKILILSVLTTLIIKKFSPAEITLWYLYTSIQGIAHMFDIGFSSTIMRFTAYSLANDRKTEFIASFQKLYNCMNVVFLGLTLLVICFLFFFGRYSIVNIVSENNIENGFLSFLILSCILPLNFFFKKNDSFIKGLNRVSTFNNWNAIMYFFTGLVTSISIILDFSFHQVVLVNQLALLINSFKNIFILKSILHEGINFFKFNYNSKVLKEYWSPTWKSALISFSSNGVNNLTSILVPNFFSVEVSASYLFSMRLIQIVNEFSWAPFYSLLPDFIKNFKQNRITQTKKRVYGRLNISIVLLIIGVIFLSYSAELVIPILEAKTQFLSSKLIAAILVMIVLERFTAMHSQVIMFSNNIEHYKQYILMALTYLILLYYLIDLLGLYAIPTAYITASLIVTFVVLKRSLELMHTSFKSYFKKYISTLIFVTIITILILIYI